MCTALWTLKALPECWRVLTSLTELRGFAVYAKKPNWFWVCVSTWWVNLFFGGLWASKCPSFHLSCGSVTVHKMPHPVMWTQSFHTSRSAKSLSISDFFYMMVTITTLCIQYDVFHMRIFQGIHNTHFAFDQRIDRMHTLYTCHKKWVNELHSTGQKQLDWNGWSAKLSQLMSYILSIFTFFFAQWVLDIVLKSDYHPNSSYNFFYLF